MIESYLVDNVWIAIVACALVYVADEWLARYEQALYARGARDRISVEGRAVSPERRPLAGIQLPLILALLAVGLYVVWWLFVQEQRIPEVFSFLVGGVILVGAASALMRLQYIVLFRHALGGGLQGKVSFSRQLVLDLSVVQLYGFAALFGLMFSMSGVYFFLGGALACLIASRRRRDLAVMVEHTAYPR